MNEKVHFTMTYDWAKEAGYEDAICEEIARAATEIDKKFWSKPWMHFACCGARLFSYALLAIAIRFKSPKFLGYAIHAIQDDIGHGGIAPWNHSEHIEIDDWNTAGDEVRERIEAETKRILRIYRMRTMT